MSSQFIALGPRSNLKRISDQIRPRPTPPSTSLFLLAIFNSQRTRQTQKPAARQNPPSREPRLKSIIRYSRNSSDIHPKAQNRAANDKSPKSPPETYPQLNQPRPKSPRRLRRRRCPAYKTHPTITSTPAVVKMSGSGWESVAKPSKHQKIQSVGSSFENRLWRFHDHEMPDPAAPMRHP